jgi:putative ABC transport system permease protein
MLKDSAAAAGTSRSLRLTRRLLVSAEVAIAMVLLMGAALLTETYVGLTRVDLGIKPERLLTFGLVLPTERYKTPESRVAFVEQLLPRLETIPGVEAAGVTNSLPVRSSFTASMSAAIEGGPPDDRRFVLVRTVSPGFARATGIRLAYGRLLGAQDARAEVAVVNRALVRRYWPSTPAKGPDPVGRRLMIGDRWCSIIGVVDDVRYSGPDGAVEAEAYVPSAYWPVEHNAVVLRTSRDPMTLVSAARQVVRGVDADVPLLDVRTMEEVMAETVAPPRFRFTLIGAFAALALVLAAIGIYGVISQSVAQRTREIGIRMALGAGRSTIAGMVLREGLALAAVGVVIGIAVSLAATRVLAGFLFGVSATDSRTFVGVALVITGLAVVASYGPARRAAKADPARVLRAE